MAIEIQLTRGYVAIVDDIDSDLAEFKWCLRVSKTKLYAGRCINWKVRTMHSIILERMIGRPLEKGEFCDHRDGNGFNNCRSNLRLASEMENQRNRSLSRNNTSGYKGASFSRLHKRWQAMIDINGKRNRVGMFDSVIDAHRAYCIAALIHYGEFANFGETSPFTGFTLADFEKPIIQLALPLPAAA